MPVKFGLSELYAKNEIRMVLQVLSDAGQMMNRCDAVFGKCGAVADAGQHQQMRGLKCAGAKDHFATRAQLAKLLALAVFDADRTLALEQDARRVRFGFDPQVGDASS